MERKQAQKWAASRFAGEPVRDIARKARVSPSTVQRATDPFGPFPLLVEVDGHLVELEVLHARWVARRRAGEGIARIAATDRVSPTTVRKITTAYGPFPPPRRKPTWTTEQQQRWIQLRHDGRSTIRIAADENVSRRAVETATDDQGPYPAPTRRHRDLLSLHDLAILTGIGAPSTYGWWRRGLLPDPHSTGDVGQLLWERQVLQDWCDAHLSTCPHCGTRALSLKQHLSKRHVAGA